MTAKPFPSLSTSRLFLDDFRDSDHPRIFEIFSNAEVMQHYDMEPLLKPEEGIEMLAFLRAKFTTNTGLRWAIREKQSKELIGTCGFNSWVSFDHSAILGYELAAPFWGKGYATEAIAEVLAASFKQYILPFHINRIEATVVPDNTGSEKVLVKNGFRLEGLLREKSYWAGRYHDLNLFSLLEKDYNKSPRAY